LVNRPRVGYTALIGGGLLPAVLQTAGTARSHTRPETDLLNTKDFVLTSLDASASPIALIVGAGLTGCTIAHRLASVGMRSVLLERAETPGGLIRSDHMNGVLYEPHGSHIFHTDDRRRSPR
jgi:NADPH-dependent 2,4-dienoyl-CoA reductase/sulfur reductase-like enzyme